MAVNWEDAYDAALNSNAPDDALAHTITPDEAVVAVDLMKIVRYMATNREPVDPAVVWARQEDNVLPDVDVPVGHHHSVMQLHIEHHGQYWEVYYGSIEFSSSHRQTGRGRTLAEALADMDKEA